MYAALLVELFIHGWQILDTTRIADFDCWIFERGNTVSVEIKTYSNLATRILLFQFSKHSPTAGHTTRDRRPSTGWWGQNACHQWAGCGTRSNRTGVDKDGHAERMEGTGSTYSSTVRTKKYSSRGLCHAQFMFCSCTARLFMYTSIVLCLYAWKVSRRQSGLNIQIMHNSCSVRYILILTQSKRNQLKRFKIHLKFIFKSVDDGCREVKLNGRAGATGKKRGDRGSGIPGDIMRGSPGIPGEKYMGSHQGEI